METAPRITTKPGHGLRVIPQTVDQWRVSAIDNGLDRRSLADLCLNGFYPPHPSRDGCFLDADRY